MRTTNQGAPELINELACNCLLPVHFRSHPPTLDVWGYFLSLLFVWFVDVWTAFFVLGTHDYHNGLADSHLQFT